MKWLGKCFLLLTFLNSLLMFAQSPKVKSLKTLEIALGVNTISFDKIKVDLKLDHANIEGLSQESLLGYRGDKKDLEITKLDISINNESIYLPYNTYAKILNPREVTIKKLKTKSYSVSIHGGDAGESYVLEFSILNGDLYRVVVRESENLGEPLWITTFPKPKHIMD